MPSAGTTTKSDARRLSVVEAGVRCFAQKGFYGTTTHEIAASAGISQPYLYRLFANKEALFIADVQYVGGLLTRALRDAPGPLGESADSIRGLRSAYGKLIEDADVRRFLMHANCATGEPLIAEAVRACYAQQVEVATNLLGGDEEAVRRWFSAGLLDNIVVGLGLAAIDEPWARTLQAS